MTIKKNKITKISIFILMLLLLFFSVKYYKVKKEFAQFKKTSELEIEILECQLGEILHKYDSLSEESKRNAELMVLNVNMRSLNDGSENQTKVDVISVNDSIIYYAKRAQEINTKIAQKTQAISKKTNLNNLKETDLTNPHHLSAVNINAKGVKIYSDLYKSSNSQIQQLRVCYTLQKNEVLKAGSRKVYIQVVNPKNQIISKGNTFVENDSGTKLQFSAHSEVNYNKKDTDVCAYVDLEQSKTIEGNYIINIYSDFTKIGSTIFEYK